MRTFSSSVRWGNVAEIWNDRMSPSRATLAGGIRVMSRPLRRMWPEVGCRNFVMRLKQVVLPAPFGPIRAWMLPRFTFRLTSSTARKPLKSLIRPSVSMTADWSMAASLIASRGVHGWCDFRIDGRAVAAAFQSVRAPVNLCNLGHQNTPGHHLPRAHSYCGCAIISKSRLFRQCKDLSFYVGRYWVRVPPSIPRPVIHH